jgi:hypothetical protein
MTEKVPEKVPGSIKRPQRQIQRGMPIRLKKGSVEMGARIAAEYQRIFHRHECNIRKIVTE